MKQNQITAFSRAFEVLFSSEQLNHLGVQTQMVERFRVITPDKMCVALVCAMGAGNTSTIADIHRHFNHLHNTSIHLKPFHKQLVKLGTADFMRQVFEKALRMQLPAYHELAPEFASKFARVLLQDGTSFRVHDSQSLHFPGRFSAHSPAAIELHVTYDIESAQPMRVSLTEDTASERDYLPSPEELKNSLLMADSGYFSKAYIESLQCAGASFIMRMPASINPQGRCIHTGKQQSLKQWLMELRGDEPLDLDIQWPDGPAYRGLFFAEKDHKNRPVCLCTNLPRESFDAAKVGDWYRARWQIELLFKEWKSMNCLHKFNTEYWTITETLVWSSLLAATLKRWLINGAQQSSRKILSLFNGAKSACYWWLQFCVQVAKHGVQNINNFIEDAYGFLSAHCLRTNSKRDSKTGGLKLMKNLFNSDACC